MVSDSEERFASLLSHVAFVTFSGLEVVTKEAHSGWGSMARKLMHEERFACSVRSCGGDECSRNGDHDAARGYSTTLRSMTTESLSTVVLEKWTVDVALLKWKSSLSSIVVLKP